MKHLERHPQPVDGCFGCKILSVQVAPSATPSRNRGAEVVRINEKESGWDVDLPAYKRLRKQGLQPKSIDGCAQLEKHAETKHELEMGHLFPKERIGAIKEDLAKARDMGLLRDDAKAVKK